MTYYRGALLLSGLYVATASAQPASTAQELAIIRVTVVDVERGRLVPNQDVLVRGDRILSVSPAGQAMLVSGVRRIDGSGAYVIPGLWDMHAHLGLSGRMGAQDLAPFVAHGVTGIRVMNTPMLTGGLAPYRDVQAQLADGRLVGPRIMAIGSWSVNGAAGVSDAMPAWYKTRTAEDGRQLARYLK